jgi:hypothetical protein
VRLSEIDPKKFTPLGHNRKALLVERIDPIQVGSIIIPEQHAGARMTDGIEPPTLSHYLPKRCKVLAVGPNVRGVRVGDIVNVPGAGNCYADLEDGKDQGSRLMIREGDIAGVYEEVGPLADPSALTNHTQAINSARKGCTTPSNQRPRMILA